MYLRQKKKKQKSLPNHPLQKHQGNKKNAWSRSPQKIFLSKGKRALPSKVFYGQKSAEKLTLIAFSQDPNSEQMHYYMAKLS
jgi:hypothetical protein